MSSTRVREVLLKKVLTLSWLLLGCSPIPGSHQKVALSARYTIGLPQPITATPLTQEAVNLLKTDLRFQRESSWDLWRQLLKEVSLFQSQEIYGFQSFYSLADLERIFNKLYGDLTREQRTLRASFSEEAISEAELWHLSSLFNHDHWDHDTYQQWLEQFDSQQKFFAMPGRDPVLFNRIAMIHMLRNYKAISYCLNHQEDICFNEFPMGSIVVKIRWQLDNQDFPLFFTNNTNIDSHLNNESWTSNGQGQAVGAITQVTLQGNSYSLVGAHFMAKTHSDWLWSTIWYDPEQSPLASDRPSELEHLNYAMCSIADFSDLDPSLSHVSPTIQKFYAKINHNLGYKSWCSNPYIELGSHNHKTNCIGCHQHSGYFTSSNEIKDALHTDFSTMVSRQSNRLKTDYSWTSNFGIHSVQRKFMRTIEYYDLYQ